jgi:thioredoxin 1
MISQTDAGKFASQVTSSTIPVLVEFFTDQCYPCKQMLPILAELAAERPETLRVFKFNAGEEPEFASQFRIASVPNFVLFQGGAPIGQRSGAAPKRELIAWIDSATSSPAR